VKIAFGVCSLGLGHATRSIPVIKKLEEEGFDIVIISHNRALTLLKKEFPNLKAYELEDFPIKYPPKAHQFIPYFFAKSNKIVRSLISSHKNFLKIHEEESFDLIISDSRFDIFHVDKPSFLIIHQLRFMLPTKFLKDLSMFYNAYMAKYFTKILVPDFKNNSLTGEMSHGISWIPKEKIEYIGPLSSFQRRDMERDIDILISISGPEPQRTLFENMVMEQMDSLDGNVVVTLGRPENGGKKRKNVYYYLPLKKREELMNRSKLIISRSGYSTIMDLYVVGGKAMFIPTPGQPEQEYLAKYLEKRKIAGYDSQDSFNLKELIERSKYYEGFKGNYNALQSVENIIRVISRWT